MSKTKKRPIDQIHYVYGHPHLPQYLGNIHTHGLAKFGQLDFQIIVMIPQEDAVYMLNSLGERVAKGERFKEGDEIEGYLQNNWKIRTKKFKETNRDVLRLIIPDENGLFPDDKGCSEPYCYQHFSINDNLPVV